MLASIPAYYYTPLFPSTIQCKLEDPQSVLFEASQILQEH